MNRDETHASGLFQGTLSHMAPEVMTEGRQSKAADVYAYGILLWELFTASRPWQDINRAHLGHAISVERRRPAFPDFTPPDLKQLAERCWSHAPDQRPTFEQVHQELVAMRKALSMCTPPVMIKPAPSSTMKDHLRLPALIEAPASIEVPLPIALAAQIDAVHASAIQLAQESSRLSPRAAGLVKSPSPLLPSKHQAYTTAYASGAIVVGDSDPSMSLQSIKGLGSLPRVMESPNEGRASEDTNPSKKSSMDK